MNEKYFLLSDIKHDFKDLKYMGWEDISYKEVLERLEYGAITPATDVVSVIHARWVECDYVEPCEHGGTICYKNKGLKCTNCIHVFKKDLLWRDKYCPNCGARMNLEK